MEAFMKLTIPDLSLVLLVGPSGCGKSTFAHRHFQPSEIVSSDFFRGLVCDDPANQAASRDAFELVHQLVARRLAWKRLTVVDATNLQADARKPLLELARKYHYLISAIAFDLGEDLCQQHNLQRAGRTVPAQVIRTQSQLLRKALGALEREGIQRIYRLQSLDEIASASVERVRMWVDRRHEPGPFDIIGDVHGCLDELLALLARLGYQIGYQTDLLFPRIVVVPPPARKAIFVGDLGDRGPATPDVYRLVMAMVQAGHAHCVMGNHDFKLLRKLRGNEVKLSHGLAETMVQFEREPAELLDRVRDFLEVLNHHYVFDEGRLVVAHAGLREDLQGRASGRVRSFALFGDTTGETDEQGLPIRLNWAGDYRGKAMVVYGHTPVHEPFWENNTINIDTGCVFGGRLTALRYPEKELVSVPSLKQYCDPVRPFQPDHGGERRGVSPPVFDQRGVSPPVFDQRGVSPPVFDQRGVSPPVFARRDDVLDLADVLGKHAIETRLAGNVVISAGNSAAALEVISRFAANPRWLIYLPPTMSPCETSQLPGLLEHPAEAFAYYRKQGVGRVNCQEKHMGSRAVVIVCKDESAARRTFGVQEEGIGVILTRTGRRFFDGESLETELLARLRAAITAAGWWQSFQSDWFCLDAELMPWSAKAQELLRLQYAAVGSSGQAALAEVNGRLDAVASLAPDLVTRYRERAESVRAFVAAYRGYCWPVNSVADLKLAPFHLLASEGATHVDKPHPWHMTQFARLAEIDPVLVATRRIKVDIDDPKSIQYGVHWWEELTTVGGEGMVVKPIDFIVRGERGVIQPAIKCRGPEYLRIIYGPEYRVQEHLERLRQRGLGAKRGLALREFALGIEALERFVRKEPLRRVHECSFGILALESEPVDPRL
jgi:protein phosphatase